MRYNFWLALYSSSTENYEECKVDKKTGKIINGAECGLQSLLAFVNNVDDVRIAEGCQTAVHKYLEDLCTPTSGDEGYPWNCRFKRFNGAPDVRSTRFVAMPIPSNRTYVDMDNVKEWVYKKGNNDTLAQMVVNYAFENCGEKNGETYKLVETRSKLMVASELEDVQMQLGNIIGEKCENAEGLWVDEAETAAGGLSTGTPLDSFYSVTFGANHENANNKYGIDSWGICVKNDIQARCRAENSRRGEDVSEDWATYDPATGMCSFTTAYFQDQCNQVRGTFIDGICYVDRDPDSSSTGD